MTYDPRHPHCPVAPIRQDPSSLCFGRSLMNAERDAAGTKRELADFKQALPDSKANDAYW